MTEPKHLKGSASLCLSYLGNETRFTNGVYLHIFPNCCLAVNVLFVASRVQQLLTKIRTRKWKNPGLNMSTAMLHHTRHEKSKAHDSVRDTLALFYCNSSITSKPNLINIHKKNI